MKLKSAISSTRVHCTCVLTLVIKKPIQRQVGGIILSPPTIINLGTPRKFAGRGGFFLLQALVTPASSLYLTGVSIYYLMLYSHSGVVTNYPIQFQIVDSVTIIRSLHNPQICAVQLASFQPMHIFAYIECVIYSSVQTAPKNLPHISHSINERSFSLSHPHINSTNVFCIWGFSPISKLLSNVLKLCTLTLINIVISTTLTDLILTLD